MTNDRMSTFEMGTQSILIRNDKVPREGVRKICKVGEFELNFQKKNAKFLKNVNITCWPKDRRNVVERV